MNNKTPNRAHTHTIRRPLSSPLSIAATFWNLDADAMTMLLDAAQAATVGFRIVCFCVSQEGPKTALKTIRLLSVHYSAKELWFGCFSNTG